MANKIKDFFKKKKLKLSAKDLEVINLFDSAKKIYIDNRLEELGVNKEKKVNVNIATGEITEI